MAADPWSWLGISNRRAPLFVLILNVGARVGNFPSQRCPIPLLSRLHHALDVEPNPSHSTAAALAEPEFKAVVCGVSSASEPVAGAPPRQHLRQRKGVAAANPASRSRGAIAWRGAGGQRAVLHVPGVRESPSSNKAATASPTQLCPATAAPSTNLAGSGWQEAPGGPVPQPRCAYRPHNDTCHVGLSTPLIS